MVWKLLSEWVVRLQELLAVKGSHAHVQSCCGTVVTFDSSQFTSISRGSGFPQFRPVFELDEW